MRILRKKIKIFKSNDKFIIFAKKIISEKNLILISKVRVVSTIFEIIWIVVELDRNLRGGQKNLPKTLNVWALIFVLLFELEKFLPFSNLGKLH